MIYRADTLQKCKHIVSDTISYFFSYSDIMAEIDLMDDHHSEDDNNVWDMKDDVPSDATIKQAVMESSNDINEEKSGD